MKVTSIVLAGGVLALPLSTAADARVTRIVIDATLTIAAPAGSLPQAIAYEAVAGTASASSTPSY